MGLKTNLKHWMWTLCTKQFAVSMQPCSSFVRTMLLLSPCWQVAEQGLHFILPTLSGEQSNEANLLFWQDVDLECIKCSLLPKLPQCKFCANASELMLQSTPVNGELCCLSVWSFRTQFPFWEVSSCSHHACVGPLLAFQLPLTHKNILIRLISHSKLPTAVIWSDIIYQSRHWTDG